MRQRLLRPLRTPWFIAAVALLFRLAFLTYKISVIPREALATLPFQNEVGNVAAALASAHGFCCLFRQSTGPTAWLSPVYPLLIALIFKIFGIFTFHAFCAAVLLNAFSSALVCIPLFYAAQRVAGKSTAALAAWLWTISPLAIILPYAWIWDTSLSALLAATILWATLGLAAVSAHLSDVAFFTSSAPEARHKLAQPARPGDQDQHTVAPRRGDTLGACLAFALYGLLWGIALLTNPTLGALLPFLLLWIFSRRSTSNDQPAPVTETSCHAERGVRPKDLNASINSQLVGALISVVVIVLVCLPWTLRNYHDFHRFIPLRSNFPYEFWSGNNELFDPQSRSVNRITRFEQTRLYAHLGETAFLDEKWSAVKTFVRTHPALYVQLCAGRVLATWFGTDSPLHDFLHADSVLARFLLLWNALSFVAMLVGLVRLWLFVGPRRGPAMLDPMSAQSPDLVSGKGSSARLPRRTLFFPVAVFPVIFPITFYLAHTSLRHRHPCDPVIMLLAAIAILGVRTWVYTDDSRVTTNTTASVPR